MNAQAVTVPARRPRRWLRIVLVLVVVLLALAVVAFVGAGTVLKRQIVAALGPTGEVQEIHLGWQGVEIVGLRIAPDRSTKTPWPAEVELSAARVLVVPRIADLFTGNVLIEKIVIDDAYVAALRGRDAKLHVLPSLLERLASDAPATKAGLPLQVRIKAIEIRRSALEFFDATVRNPALKLRLEKLQLTLGPLDLPSLSGKTDLNFEASVKGNRHDGSVKVNGWVELASRDMHLTTQLRSVDMVPLQPYLLKAAEAGARSGSMDLDLDTTIKQRALQAPGTLTLSNLELTAGSGAMTTFMGVPRQLVLAALKDKQDRIVLKFTLAGNLDDPRFSLNENLAGRLSVGVAQSLGIGLEGLARGVGSVSQNAVEGVGSVAKKLFGK